MKAVFSKRLFKTVVPLQWFKMEIFCKMLLTEIKQLYFSQLPKQCRQFNLNKSTKIPKDKRTKTNEYKLLKTIN